MKKFLKKCSFFLIILLLVWGGIEFFFRTVPNNYTVKNENVKKAYTTAEALFFGNSHAFYGLNPDFFKVKSYNLSNVSQTIFFDKLLFEKHAFHFKKLKYIVLTVEYTSLSHKQNYGDMAWRKYFYESQMDLHTGLISPFDIKKYSLALAPGTQLTASFLRTYFKNGTLAQSNLNGFAEYRGVLKESANAMAGRAKMKLHEDGSLEFKENLSRLREIIWKCKQRNIKVILVNMPVTNHYANNVNPAKRQKIIASCKELKEGNNNVFYLDMFKDSRFDNNDFYDVDHLNTDGAKKCSDILDDYIQRIK